MNGQPTQKPLTIPEESIFISYSRRDKKYLTELHTHFALYERMGDISYWDDTKILPGMRWKNEITHALDLACIAIFLVSADFLASDFIADREMGPLLKTAQERGTVILSVILGTCAFGDCDLAKFQAVNQPTEPLNQMSKGKREEVWTRLASITKNTLKNRYNNI